MVLRALGSRRRRQLEGRLWASTGPAEARGGPVLALRGSPAGWDLVAPLGLKAGRVALSTISSLVAEELSGLLGTNDLSQWGEGHEDLRGAGVPHPGSTGPRAAAEDLGVTVDHQPQLSRHGLPLGSKASDASWVPMWRAGQGLTVRRPCGELPRVWPQALDQTSRPPECEGQ